MSIERVKNNSSCIFHHLGPLYLITLNTSQTFNQKSIPTSFPISFDKELKNRNYLQISRPICCCSYFTCKTQKNVNSLTGIQTDRFLLDYASIVHKSKLNCSKPDGRTTGIDCVQHTCPRKRSTV